MDEIMRIAEKHDLYVIEDATESLGAHYKGTGTGSFGTFGCFSFNGNKVITTGGGGMVTGNDLPAMNHIRFLVNQANDGQNGYFHPEIGFNYRMTNVEAALGLAQFERLDQFLKKKREFNDIYKEELGEIKSMRFQAEPEGGCSSCWLSALLFDNKIDLSALQGELRARGVPTRRVFTPVTEFPPYKPFKQANCENAYHIYAHGLCLPSSTLNSRDQIHYTCGTLKELL
jgi:perosamine synthetase